MITQCSAGGFGSPTDWLSAIAAIISAIGLFVVSAKTNRFADKANDLSQANAGLATTANDIAIHANGIGKSANYIAESVVNIERARDEDSASVRAAEQSMLLIALVGIMGHASADLKTVVDTLDNHLSRAIPFQPGDLERLTAQVISAQYTIPESVRSRIHFVDAAISARALRTEGLFHMLRVRYADENRDRLTKEMIHLAPTLRKMYADTDFVFQRGLEAVQASGIDGPP